MSDTEFKLRFWRALADYLGHACALFGMPATLARKLWLSRAEHARISAFLRGCEDILRRLIFIDALAPPLAASSPLVSGPASFNSEQFMKS